MLSRYTAFERLGQGGMGVVYRATDTQLQRAVALKFVTARFGTEEQARARFLREARMAAALNHPAICTIYEVGETQPGGEDRLGQGERLAAGTPFIAMELIEGRPLDAILRSRGRFALDQLVDVAIPIAEALAAAHAKGVLVSSSWCSSNSFSFFSLEKEDKTTTAHLQVLRYRVLAT
jgi:serine/threonine protein kinase